jgi:hypothetical protein
MTYDFNNKTINDLKTRVNTLNSLLATTAKKHIEIVEPMVMQQTKLINWTIANMEDLGVCPKTYKINN